MSIQEVIKMGHPTLRLKAQPVPLEEIQTEAFRSLVNDMFETMEEQEGIGIAAPQINVSKQVAIVGIPTDNPRYEEQMDEQEGDEEEDPFEAIVIINPVIKPQGDTILGFWEGCLSVPGLRGYVERPDHIITEFYDMEGKKQELELKGFPAIVFQHECDHLEGKLYVDRITDITKLSYIDEYMEYIEESDEMEEEQESDDQ